ncbi:MAG TPA: ABC transporter ATP-binding protein [Bacteroidales bacterium]|nr:ABC transporter ATP-binding protein [Bacteroidales bacterium]
MSILHVKQKWFTVAPWKNYTLSESYAEIEREYPMVLDRRNFDVEEAAVPAHQREISMRDLTYTVGSRDLLKDIRMSFEPRKKYLILGDKDSGTEELIEILMKKITAYKGSITICEKELEKVEKGKRCRDLSLVSSRIPVIKGSVYENVLLDGKSDWTKVRDSMGKVGLLKLENENIKTEDLSDIEKKRISIARALVDHSSILILDETAGSENNAEEYEIEELILNMREMTVLSISHRLTKSLMEKYDKIFILDKGSIIEEGTFSELLLNNGNFYNRYVSSET